MKKAFCITTLFILLAAFQCRAQTQSNNAPLTNKDVIELLKMGLSPDVIVAKIKNSSSNFDTSPAALQELKTANAPEAVILAMVQAPSSTNQASATLSEKPAPKTGVKNLYEVRKIYIDEMGKSDDSERFRLLLREKLSDKGFTIVESPDDADAILKGTLATQLSQGTTKARASVYLKSQSGAALWNDDFGVRFAFGPHRDSIKLRAEDVANGLHGAWKKSAKAAGIKTSS
jgi:hypothetical protein